jgi:type I protein arginine methyltransferase
LVWVQDLDFLEMIKMINYIRSEVQQGNETPNLSSKAAFEEEHYLKPFLEQDALLYSLDDIIGPMDQVGPAATNGIRGELSGVEDMAVTRIAELEQELHRLQSQFLAYRETVDQTLENRWNSKESDFENPRNALSQNGVRTAPRDDDTHYFSSYSSNGQ